MYFYIFNIYYKIFKSVSPARLNVSTILRPAPVATAPSRRKRSRKRPSATEEPRGAHREICSRRVQGDPSGKDSGEIEFSNGASRSRR